MPLLTKSLQKNAFKVPLADHKNKIKEIIDHKLNEPKNKKAYCAFIERLSQEKRADGSRPEETCSQPDAAKKISKRGKSLSFDTEGSLSQEELNSAEIKAAYLEFVNNSLGSEEGMRAFIYSSSEELIDDVLESENKLRKKESTSKRKTEKHRKQTLSREPSTEFPGLTDEEKMNAIYEKRNVGLYVLCDKCDKARYLPHVVDPLDLPDTWFCYMNPDRERNNCADPEVVTEDPEFLIENLYNAGSIVFVKIGKYPWWPAMVEDNIETETYFWLGDDSMAPTFYHVTLFGSKVSRVWVKTESIRPFMKNLNNPKYQMGPRRPYKRRVDAAVKQALDAASLPLIDRLKNYGFLKRYKKSAKRGSRTKNKGNPSKRRRRMSRQDDMSAILENVNISDMSF